MPFESLHDALANLFEKPLASLPKELLRRVEKEYYPLSWDNLSVDHRRMKAEQWDYQHDPAKESDRQYWWDFYQRMQAIEAQIEQWTTIATPTATDLTQQETRLAALKLELAAMKNQEKKQQQSIGAPHGRLSKENQAALKLEFIAYPKAMKLLTERLQATPEELAAWIFVGPEQGGLAAYLNANELESPPRFYYGPGREGDFDYLSPLMSCWFSAVDIANFQPAERFITGDALIERWSTQQDIKPRAFIMAKIRESRLADMHPIYGGTAATFSEIGSFPPLETGLFSLSHVEAIEREDGLSVVAQKNETAGQRCERLKKRILEEKLKGTKAFFRTVADEEKISVTRLKQIISDVATKNSPWAGLNISKRQTSSKKEETKY